MVASFLQTADLSPKWINMLTTHPSLMLQKFCFHRTKEKHFQRIYILSESTVKAPSLRFTLIQFTCWDTSFHHICGDLKSCLDIAEQSWWKCAKYYMQNSLPIKLPKCGFFNHLQVLFTNLYANSISKHAYLGAKWIIKTFQLFHIKWNIFFTSWIYYLLPGPELSWDRLTSLKAVVLFCLKDHTFSVHFIWFRSSVLFTFLSFTCTCTYYMYIRDSHSPLAPERWNPKRPKITC